ncbi:MAG: hypothetical protein ACE5KW_05785, partial [Dehalococcoidia bacterium]
MSNVRNVTGFLTPLDSRSGGERGKVSIALRVTGAVAGPAGGATPFGSVWGEPDADDVHYSVPLLGPLRAQLRLQGLRDRPQLGVNRAYHRLVRLRLGNVQPVGKHLTDVVAVKLLEHGYALAHAAALAFRGQGILLVAPPKTGKSLASLQALDRGFSFLAEDVAITDGERVYGLPLTSSFAWDIGVKELGLKRGPARRGVQLFQWVAAYLPPLSHLLPQPSLNVLGLAPQTRIESQAPLSG